MPSKTPSKKQVQAEVKEEEMEMESTAPTAKTPKTPKKNAQAKLTSFFGSAAKGKNATGEGSTVSGSSGLKSPKKEEPETPVASPVKTPAKRKSGGGKTKETEKKEVEKKEKKGKAAPKEVEIKEEIKEEPMDEEEGEEGSESGSGEYEVEKILAHFWDEDGELMFKVKWVGYEKEEEQTDEPEENLETATEKIEEYLQSLPKKAKDEYEKKTGNKIAGAAKGAKKRPISETISTPSSTANKKVKKDDSEKENGSKRKSAGGSKQEKGKKNANKTAKAKVKKESKTDEERIAFIEERRQKCFEYSEEDSIGKAIQKGHEALMDMIKSNADPQTLTTAAENLKNERDVCLKADKKSGKKDPLRDMAYTICEKLENMLISLSARETEKARVKKEQQEGDDDTVSLMAVSRVVDGIEVKEEDDGDIEKEVKTEEVEAQ